MDDREIEAPMLLSGVAIKDDQQDESWKPKRDGERTKVQEQELVLNKFD